MNMGPLALSSIGGLPDIAMTSSVGASAPPRQVAAGDDFASVLRSTMGSAVDTLRQGETAAIAGVKGTMPVQTVVEQVMAAERTLQAAIAVRDKFVSAYLEISRMQV
jgi:flagellar hook-basal body complex protein FliE